MRSRFEKLLTYRSLIVAIVENLVPLIRAVLAAGLYGGSVNPKNAGAILALPEVDGALVGGASLNADDFWAIAQSCPAG